MHKLTRCDAPLVLNEFDHNIHNWDVHFKSRHKALVWEKIFEMQGHYCAYCECKLDSSDPKKTHLEHFRQKGKAEYRHLTFEWTNIFGSCCNGERCGRHKDKSNISSENIVKMDEEDPEDYFVFLSTGAVGIRDGLSPVEVERAENTLRAFNLNPSRGGVKNERERVIKTHDYMIKEMIGLMSELRDDGGLEFLIEIRDSYIERVASEKGPFVTAIKHVLISNWERAV
ncbi:retron Ec78 anti-phage system effector HNH endonuclease PtuB [Serratia rubidaea]|uniref:retron Ec78 anti-phage system effector HNH endonuclease PtuB n=1 Tax=Serratia rubidaea TaxID=61652 RepID=UPI0022B8761C|nr:retron Ec78 anti-phage system effector HNH endonuclease PtuB [Serratia rubidaea]WBF43961.1 TIGR02646 family protein [Serratia rubidaea]